MRKAQSPFVCADPAELGRADRSSSQTRDDLTRDILASSADDRTIRLLLDVHPAFEGLRTVAGQLAGLLILAAAGASGGRLDGSLLDAARLTYKETRERVLNLAVEDSIRHVAHHLRLAAEGIEATIANVERESRAGVSFDGTRALALLKGAYRHLESVSKLTPGFRLVDTSNSCCGFGH
ncbi:MAG: hypothetical protein JO136_02470 [Hyphomicrobiales bacterium]|nr:hypothetical protein [Hyphomicrobiales bacterium]